MIYECDSIDDVRAEDGRLVFAFNSVTVALGEDCARALAYILLDLVKLDDAG